MIPNPLGVGVGPGLGVRDLPVTPNSAEFLLGIILNIDKMVPQMSTLIDEPF